MAAAATGAPAPPQATAAQSAPSSVEPMYQNGMTRPSTRAPSLWAATLLSSGSRSTIGLKNTATANSTPTITPTTTSVTAANAFCMTPPQGFF